MLRAENAIADADGFYADLLALHAGLAPEDSLKLCAKLILLLANEVGDRERLNAILAAVRPATNGGVATAAQTQTAGGSVSRA